MLGHQIVAYNHIVTEMIELCKTKSSDYSDHAVEKGESDNITELGLPGLYVRMVDKMSRLKKFMWHGRVESVSNETIEDALKDLANYCIISLMLRRGLWQKPKVDGKPGVEIPV